MSINLHAVGSVNNPYCVLSWVHLYRGVLAKATAAKWFRSQSGSQPGSGGCGGPPWQPDVVSDAGMSGSQSLRIHEVSIRTAAERDW